MGVLGGLVEEQVLHYQAIERGQRRLDMLGIGVGLGHVLTLAVKTAKFAVYRRVKHIGDAHARLRVQRNIPLTFEQRSRGRVGQVAVARQLVGKRTHVAGALHIVLAPHGIHPDTFPAKVTGQHRKIGNAHYCGGTLAVLGHAKAVVNRRVAAGGIQPGGLPQ